MPTREDLTGNRLIAVIERGLVETHSSRKPPEDLGRRQTLAARSYSRFIPSDVKMSVGNQQVAVLDLHGCRQQDVGIARGVSHKVLDDNGKKIVARQAA